MLEKLEMEIVVLTNGLDRGIKKAEQNVKNLKNTTKSDRELELSFNLAKVRTQYDNLKMMIKEAKRMGDDAIVIQLQAKAERLKLDLNEANRALRNLRNTGDETKSMLGKMLEDTGIFGTIKKFIGPAAIGGAIKGLFDFGQEAQRTEIAFQQMTGSIEKGSKLYKEMQDFAKDTPFGDGVLQAAKLMMAMGYEAENILPTMKSVGEAVSAMGGSDAELMSVARALGQIKAKGKLSAEEVNQLAERGIGVWEILGEKMQKPVGELQKMAEKGQLLADDVLPLILQSFDEKYGEMMDKMSDTAQGRLDELLATLKITVQELGKIFAPIFSAILKGLLGILQFFQSGAGKVTIFVTAMSGLTLAFGLFKAGIIGASLGLGTFGGVTATVTGGVIALKGALMALMTTPIGWILMLATAVGGIGMAIYESIKASEKQKEMLNKNSKSIVEQIKDEEEAQRKLNEAKNEMDEAEYKRKMDESKAKVVSLRKELEKLTNAQENYNIQSKKIASLGKNNDIDYQRQLENRKFQVGNQIFMGRENIALGIQKAQAEFEQKIRQDDMVRNNPRLATQAMIESYRKQGINAMRSDAEIIADIEQQVASGRSLGEALTQLNRAYQSKEEYKAMMAGQMQKWNPTEYKEIGGQLYKIQNGQLSDTGISTQAEKYQHINLGDGKVGVFNPRTGKVEMVDGNISQGVGTLSHKRLNAQDGEYVGVQCGQFAREAVGMSAVPGGNNLSARKKEFHEKTPKVGGMVLFAGGGYDATYGHIAVVESINDDGSINIVESNLKNDKSVSRRTIPVNAVGLYGFYNNTPLAKSMMDTSNKEITTLKDVRLPAKTSESSKKSYSFGVRMYDSNNIIEQLEEKFVNKNFLQQGWDKYAPSFLQSAEAQQWEQARRDFINAVLRKESGAAIGKDEFDNAEKQYFAQPGDTQEVIAQKRANRENAIRGMFVDVGVDENGTQLVDIWKNEGKGRKVGNENNNNPLQYTSYSVKASNGITYEYDASTGEVIRNK